MNFRAADVDHQPVGQDEAHRGPSYGGPLVARRVVVTGGAGFIGSHLCDALLAGGDTVTCVDNLVGSAGTTRNVDHLFDHPRFELDARSVLDWAAHCDLSGVSCIFHQAASKSSVSLVDPERDLSVNALGTLRLLLRAAEAGVGRFVHASTGSVFGETDAVQAEDTPKEPVSLYGISKLAGESYCRVVGELYGLDYTVLRYYHVIGPRQDSSDSGGVVPIFVRRCLEGQPLTIYGTGAQTRSFTSVRDVVRANLAVVESDRARGEHYNCASGISVSISELAEFIMAETGSTQPVEYAPARPGDVPRFEVDNSKLRRLGIAFETDWRSVVREVIFAQRQSLVPFLSAP
jgi:UDP-glucose 4-epimerase